MLKFENIRVEGGGKRILCGIDLEIRPGEKILLEGDSGSGKSTLLKAMLGFADYQGKIFFDGTELSASNIAEYRSRIAYVGQRIPPFRQKVWDVIRIADDFRGNKAGEMDDKPLKAYMSALKLDEKLLDSPFESLSGGEKQRIVLITVLLRQRPFCIMDEVTAALDADNRDRVTGLLTSDADRTVLLVAHNLDGDSGFGRKIKLRKGEIVEDRLL